MVAVEAVEGLAAGAKAQGTAASPQPAVCIVSRLQVPPATCSKLVRHLLDSSSIARFALMNASRTIAPRFQHCAISCDAQAAQVLRRGFHVHCASDVGSDTRPSSLWIASVSPQNAVESAGIGAGSILQADAEPTLRAGC